ncbi:MAG: M57 family metalloprotease [Myxococcota bacterium]|nr:M57 family metalloprotease [Myxococcota bacterium]
MNKGRVAIMMTNTTKILFTAAAVWQLGGCTVGEEATVSTNQGPTWEEFRATVYQENFEGGHFIVNGDIAIADEKQLYEFWESLQQGALIVNRVGGADDRWNDTAKLNLTYCISNNFGTNKTRMVTAMNTATAKWESLGNVNFIHVTAQDASCTASNPNVVFDIRPVSGQSYLARAFFPSSPRSSRNVLVDSSSFGNVGWPLENIIGHELGHTLGFRHEHTRPEAGTCFEDNNWRPLTPYDSGSIMHYPQCNGSSNNLDWTARDGEGVAALYGAPGGQPPPPPPPGTEKTDTKSGSVGYRQLVQVSNYAVKVGSTFSVTMTGSGDPDLYVRWNSAPTTTSFNCRPYIDGATEQCSLTVPTGATRAYVAVRGYQAGTYNLTIKYTSP